MKEYPSHYVPAKKRHIVADLIGESGYVRVYVARISNPIKQIYMGQENGEIRFDPTGLTNYAINHTRYSRNDGKVLFDCMIYTDENDCPFQTLADVIRFIKIDAVDFWPKKAEEMKVRHLISDGDNLSTNHELFMAEENAMAWSQLYDCCRKYLSENGEPKPLRHHIQ